VEVLGAPALHPAAARRLSPAASRHPPDRLQLALGTEGGMGEA